MFQYQAEVLRWVDGDTVWLKIDLGFYTHRETDVRLARINAPERVEWSLRGLVDEVKAYNEKRLPPGSVCIVEITKRDKYGRWLGEIRYLEGSSVREDILQNGRVLNDELLENGLVKVYKK